MTVEELAEFIKESIPTFIDVQCVGPGVGYHYTPHGDAIRALGRFLGAPIDKQLDKTQYLEISHPATLDPGVVFAYEELSAAREEGYRCEILEVRFTAAVRATHRQEAQLGAPPTLLILNTDIRSFKSVSED